MSNPETASFARPGILISARRIRRRVNEIAREIAGRCGPGPLVAVAILKGSFVFAADLARALSDRGLHLAMDFLTLSSYGSGTTSASRIATLQDIGVDVARQRVLLIDDILDTGRTLQAARDRLLAKGAREVLTCVLLDKPARRIVSIQADYVGFNVDNVFVVGYGLDFDNRYRNLPYLAVLPPGVAGEKPCSNSRPSVNRSLPPRLDRNPRAVRSRAGADTWPRGC